ncbi:MAG: ABC transporter permease [Candidatus Melainabacteria bacterium]|nr:ABC transporter permease [Candidatus Melainabacteria bacterium]
MSLLEALCKPLLGPLLARMGLTLSGIFSIFRKEIIQLLRDKYLLTFIITLPIIQLLVTGLAIQKDLRYVPTLVYNYDKRNASVELIKAFQSSTFFSISGQYAVRSEEELARLVHAGRYRVGIVIPPEYSSNLLSGREPARVNILIDGTNANISKIILDAAHAIVSNHSKNYLTQGGGPVGSPVQLAASSSVTSSPEGAGSLSSVLSPSLGASPAVSPARSLPIQLSSKVVNNPDLKTSFFLIPGILGIIMHMMTVLFTSFSIVRERESGTLEQLMVSPIRVTDLMVGKVLPYAVIGLLDMLLTLGVMVWFFSIPITGSFWFLLLASVIFIFTSLGLGLLISTTCTTQVQAIQLTMGLLLPSLLLTGFVFPLEPMPWFVKLISYSLPLTYYLDIIRGVVIKGIGAEELWQQTLMILLSCVLMVGASILRFKKQVA